MAELVSIVYPSAKAAFEARKRLFELQGQFLVELADAVAILIFPRKIVARHCTRGNFDRGHAVPD
jgi:uncharacterized membrane protein